MKTRLAILLWRTDPADPERCATPFVHAAAAAAMDAEVEVYFTAQSVRLLAGDVATRIRAAEHGGEPIAHFMREAANLGARFFACPQAVAACGLTRDDLGPLCSGQAGAAAFVARALDPAWQTLTY